MFQNHGELRTATKTKIIRLRQCCKPAKTETKILYFKNYLNPFPKTIKGNAGSVANMSTSVFVQQQEIIKVPTACLITLNRTVSWSHKFKFYCASYDTNVRGGTKEVRQ